MLNRRLYLKETDGWMECEYCQSLTRATDYPENIQEVYESPKYYTVRGEKAVTGVRRVRV